MGFYETLIRSLVKKDPNLKKKLIKGGSKLTPFQYIHQTFMMSFMSLFFVGFIIYLFFKKNPFNMLLIELINIFAFPIYFKFWYSFVDVLIEKYKRALNDDLMFISEYLLICLESGLPLGNAIEGLSKLKRPGGKFFKNIYLDFKTGTDLDKAIYEWSTNSPSDDLKNLLKKLSDSLTIGVNLKKVLENFINETSDKKIVEIKAYSKKLNPKIMMYLLLGVVLPSLGTTFFILGASIMQITPLLLKYILIFIFMFMYLFQYMSYSSFKFSKETL